MPEIACTNIGRNSLFMGLICHISAVLVMMMTASGASRFFGIVYSFSCLFFIATAYIELKHVKSDPLMQWQFYATGAATVLPLLGPLLVLIFLYGFQEGENRMWKKMLGFIPAVLRLKMNMLIGFMLVIVLLILFILTVNRSEPYYKRGNLHYQSKNILRSFVATRNGNESFNTDLLRSDLRKRRTEIGLRECDT